MNETGSIQGLQQNEYRLCKQNVAGSIPVASTIKSQAFQGFCALFTTRRIALKALVFAYFIQINDTLTPHWLLTPNFNRR